jgi:hypothetical protein
MLEKSAAFDGESLVLGHVESFNPSSLRVGEPPRRYYLAFEAS